MALTFHLPAGLDVIIDDKDFVTPSWYTGGPQSQGGPPEVSPEPSPEPTPEPSPEPTPEPEAKATKSKKSKTSAG